MKAEAILTQLAKFFDKTILEVGILQRITNCIVKVNEQILMLQKPSRGWWVVPGGKMERGESVHEAVTREYREETGLHIQNPQIKGIFTIIIKDGDKIVNEWMMFTFFTEETTGDMLAESPEGKLEWKLTDEVAGLPMAPGDKFIFEHILHSDQVLYGTFHYTENFELLSYRLGV